jgi:hypothetical protein
MDTDIPQSTRFRLEDCINETECILRLLTEAYANECSNTGDASNNFLAGLTTLRIGAIERLNSASDAVFAELSEAKHSRSKPAPRGSTPI